jgi:MFS family permease
MDNWYTQMGLSNGASALAGMMITMYFVGFGFGGLLSPLADKYGRRPVCLALLFGNLMV